MVSKYKQSLCSKRTLKLKERATKQELIFKSKLDDLKIKYMFQKGFISGDYFAIVDFYLPKYKLCIEVDGDYHNTKDQQLRDKYRTSYLNKRGFKVHRFTNNESEHISLGNLSRVIESYA
jgi:very-short-patch-repair endonuclease